MLYRIATLGWFTLLSLSFCIAQQQARSSNAEAQRLFEEAEKHRAGNDMDAAMYAYRQACQKDAYFVAPLNHLAALHQEAGQLDSTIHYYSQSLKIYPRGLMAHQNLATAYQLKGDAPAAINQYRELLRNYPDYPEAYYAVALA
ncbi:MAG: tetratricopeptide repeat protein, partial [Bacteroidota bacterium]